MIDELFSVPKSDLDIYSNNRINGLLDKSVIQYKATLVQGVIGIGKTCFVSNWITEYNIAENYAINWLDCKNTSKEQLDCLNERIHSCKEPVLLVMDHFEKVAFGELEEVAVQLCKGLRDDDRYIFITSGKMPDFFISEIATQRANVIPGMELMLNGTEVKQYINVFKGCSLNMDGVVLPEWFPTLPVALNLMIVQYEMFGRTFPEMLGYLTNDLYSYYSACILDKWEEEERKLIQRVHPYAVITKDVIRMLYGDEEKCSVLEEFSRKNCFLQQHNLDEYTLVGKIGGFLERLFAKTLEKEEYRQIIQTAIDYYEKLQDYQYVVKLYLNIEAYGEALAAIIKCHRNESIKEFKMCYVEYIKRIPKEVIEKNPEAVFWMAVNSLVKFDLDGFNRWYEVFMENYNSDTMASDNLGSMEEAFVYLKMVSPFTTLDEFLHIVRRGYGRYTMEEFIKQLFSYSEMDMATFLLLRNWNFEDGIERLKDNAMVEEFLGNRLYTLIMVYLGNRYCLAHRMEEAEECLVKGTFGCREAGMYGPGLFGELTLLDVQKLKRKSNSDVLGKKKDIIKWAMAKQDYIKQYDSVNIRIWLQLHDIDRINDWIVRQRKVITDSHNLINYRNFIQQVRVLILIENLYDAQLRLDSLIQSLQYYHFEIDLVECLTLYSIICYRRNLLDKAVQYFLKAYWKAKQHQLLMPIACEGIAIQPILLSVARRLPNLVLEPQFKELLRIVKIRAQAYPKYLTPKTRQKDILTKTEEEILLDLDSNYTLSEIAEKRCISINTVKQHTKSIYGKLKVNKRNMAIRVAKERGLI